MMGTRLTVRFRRERARDSVPRAARRKPVLLQLVDSARAPPVVRRGSPVVRLAAGILAAGLLIAFPAASSGAAASPDRPNIVLILTDDQPFESLSRMPFVDGRKDWVRFENAFLNTPICCPARASILNGRYSHRNHVETNLDGHRFRDRSTVATWLQDEGYRTGFFGKYLNGYPWGQDGGGYVPPGWDRWLAFNGLPGYFNYELNNRGSGDGPAQTVVRGSIESDYSTDVISRKATRFIGKVAGRSRPFFAFVSFFAPHGPAIAAPRHEQSFENEPVLNPPNFNEPDVSDKPLWIQNSPLRDPVAMAAGRRKQYELMLSVDEGVRGIFKRLRASRELRRTIVIYLSDNGFLWGEHRDTGKACAYEECIQTPLLIRARGIDARSEEALVSNVDLAPTIARWAGARPPGNVDGRGLRRLLNGQAKRVRRTLLIHGKQPPSLDDAGQPPSFWGVRTHRFKYVETPVTKELELYDLLNDPFELENLAGRTASAERLSDLGERLAALRSR